MNRLLIPGYGPCSWSDPIVTAMHDAVSTGMEARAVIAGFYLFAEYAVEESEGWDFFAMINGHVQNHPCGRRQPFWIIVEKAPLDVWLYENARTEGAVDLKVCTGLEICSKAENNAGVIDVNPIRPVGLWNLRQKVEFQICFALSDGVGRRYVE